jgi:hypothetical protein
MDLAAAVSRQWKMLGRLLGEGITVKFSCTEALPDSGEANSNESSVTLTSVQKPSDKKLLKRTANLQGLFYCNFIAHIHKLIMNGAGEGNRTLVKGIAPS